MALVVTVNAIDKIKIAVFLSNYIYIVNMLTITLEIVISKRMYQSRLDCL